MTDAEAERDRLRDIAEDQPPFGRHMGVRILVAERDRVEAELIVEESFCNRNGVMHGGAIMGFADNVGGTASFLNIKPGETTATLESKTNFFRALPAGSRVRAVCAPIHIGRKTMVLETRVLREDGKLAALVIQTQMVLRWERS